MKLSEKAWNISSQLIEAIKLHPFNQELRHGTLALDKFAYYIEQDILYLQDFAKCLAILASKVPLTYTNRLLHYSDQIYTAEQEVVHNYFKTTFNLQETKQFTPATLSYTNHLLRICTMEDVEIGIAAVLPCFWVYREVGLAIAKATNQHNIYARWIETYASIEFSREVNELISIFDELATKTTDAIKSKMLDAFYKSICLEWHFWNDAYNKTVFDNISSKI